MAPHNNTNNNDSLFHTVPSAATAAPSDEDSPLWSISVKTVGAEQQRTNDNGTVIPSSFQIKVQPNEDIGSLQDRIETMTGLKPHQQRLIYRGRLILPNPQEEEQQQQDDTNSNNNNHRKPTKISEIKGLSDGQTIHLVRRPASTPSSPSSNNNNNNTRTPPRTSNNNATTTTDDSFPSSPGTSSLLAALLGLSALEEEAASEDAPSPTTTPQRWRRYGRRNRNPYRLTAQDLQVPDPGSMESVRQGLLTLHTLLPLSTNATQNPLDVPRQWYLGQWIDCRDTVNQWLEATIVDMVRPEDVLPASFLARERQTNNSATPATVPAMDPAVAASDMEGRRRLLLEPSDNDDDDDEEENDLEHLCELHGWQRRAGDHDRNVVLLLIHYNGWPHRWDEWIRSDSERIRPFRVRTRHATHGPHTSPTTQSQYTDSPSTTFLSTGQEDRSVLLQELVRVTGQVHTLAQAAAQGVPAIATPVETNDTAEPTVAESRRRAELLPWIARDNEGGVVEATQDAAETATLDPSHSLATLAPLLDRLGRTLVDAAPHVASLAAAVADSTPNRVDVPHAELVGALTEEEEEEEEAQEDNDNEPASPQEEGTSSPNNNNNRDNPNSLGGLLSMLNGERRRNSRTSQVTDQALTHVSSGDGMSVAASTTPAIDPDYMDFATGLVNVSRGDVRSGPRGARHGRTSSAADDIGGLLGAYLAAASLGGLGSTGGTTLTTGDTNNNNNNNTTNDLQGLGQLLRNRGTGDTGGGTGGGGGGIDIHIHAVVTAPGGGGGGTGTTAAILAGGGGGTGLGALAMAGGGGTAGDTTTASSPDLFANTRRATAQRVRATLLEQNEEDAGIFDDLYSENPAPVSPTSSADDTANNNEGANSRRDSTTASESTHRASPPRRGSRRRDSSNNSTSNNGNNNRSSSFLGRLFRRGGGTD